MSLPNHSPGCNVAYFFCKDGQVNIVEQILRGMVYQLCVKDGAAYERVKGV